MLCFSYSVSFVQQFSFCNHAKYSVGEPHLMLNYTIIEPNYSPCIFAFIPMNCDICVWRIFYKMRSLDLHNRTSNGAKILEMNKNHANEWMFSSSNECNKKKYEPVTFFCVFNVIKCLFYSSKWESFLNAYKSIYSTDTNRIKSNRWYRCCIGISYSLEQLAETQQEREWGWAIRSCYTLCMQISNGDATTRTTMTTFVRRQPSTGFNIINIVKLIGISIHLTIHQIAFLITFQEHKIDYDLDYTLCFIFCSLHSYFWFYIKWKCNFFV